MNVTTGLKVPMRRLRERTITSRIKSLLARKGWMVLKIAGSPMQTTGLPDILAIKRGEYLWVEIKVPGNSLSQRQRFMHSMLIAAGARVVVVHSAQDVEDILTA